MNDYYWLNEDSRKFLSKEYLSEGETPESRVRYIAESAESILKIKGFADKFESYMKKGWYSLSSPIWANFGNKRGYPISCNGSYIDDTMDSILEKVNEVGVMTKNGAGTSAYFGALRPRGSKISVGGTSPGPVHFMELFDVTCNIVSQSNIRRGSFAAYLPVEHPDVLEFLKIRDTGHKIQSMSFGVTISDEWMGRMLDGDKEKRDIWANIIRKRFESGYPYIFFSDNVNQNAPQVYKDKGIKIYASNLCVAGDQRVVSNRGLLTAEELYHQGGELELFDNDKKVKSSAMNLIEKDADTYRIVLENGMSHTVTKNHKISVYRDGSYKDVECGDIKIGDLVKIQTEKGLFGDKNMPKEAFLLGLYQGDGTQHKDLIMIDIWENDFDLLQEVQSYHDYVCDEYKTQSFKNHVYEKPRFHDCVVQEGSKAKKRIAGKALKKALNFEKGYVPHWIWEGNEDTVWQYIKGLFYSDGTVFISNSSGNPIQLSLASINKDFLQEVQLLLSNLGMQSSIRILRGEGENLLPDGKGGQKLYRTQTCYRLIIGNKNDALIFNEKTKFLDRKGIKIENREYRDNTKKHYKVQAIEYVGKQDVYCVTVESDKHHWVCNGIVTHNCSEILLSSSPEESFVCNLSSMNLLHYEEWKTTDAVEVLLFFLDAVMTEYIEKTDGVKGMTAAHTFAKRQRAIGLGVLGWHSYLQSRMIAFESIQAKMKNIEIHKFIHSRCEAATKSLAGMYGEPEMLKGYGRRNTTTMALAPTTSSSFILGQVSPSIEPLHNNYLIKDLAKGKFTYKNPYLIKLLESKGKNNDKVWESILIQGGSVQHLDFLSSDEKDIFKTFAEISQKEIVIQASARQKYIDQTQSLNLMIPANARPKDVSDLLIEGWRLGIKTFYYQRSSNPSQDLARKIFECASCAA